jgi:hypothetical protein
MGGAASAFSGLNPYHLADGVQGAPGVDSSKINNVDTTGTGAAGYASGLGVQNYGNMSAPTQMQAAQIGSVNPAQTAQIQGLNGGNGIAGNDFRQGMGQSMGYLNGVANGSIQDPSAAMMQQGQAASLANTYAMANSQRGQFNPANARGAMQQGAQSYGQMASGLAAQSAQNRIAAAQGAGALGAQGYGQDASLAGQQAGLQQQTNMTQFGGDLQKALMQAQLQQGANQTSYGGGLQTLLQNGQLGQAFNSSLLGAGGLFNQVGQGNNQTQIQLQQLIQSGALGNAGIGMQKVGMGNQIMGGLIGGAGQAGAASLMAPAAAAAAG